MSLMRRSYNDPFEDMERVMNRMRALVGGNLMPYDREETAAGFNTLTPVDVRSSDDEFVIRAALPGIPEEEVDIDVNGRVVTISAEHRAEHTDEGDNWHIRELHVGRVGRTIRLPEDVNPESATAIMSDGILTLTLPKALPRTARKIAVTRADQLESGSES